MAENTRIEPAGADACARHPQPCPRASRAQRAFGTRSQVRTFSFHARKDGHPSGCPSFLGGRYKTRTCDLPHVKRMRYQLRQSSVSLDRIHPIAALVKSFLAESAKFFAPSLPDVILRRQRRRRISARKRGIGLFREMFLCAGGEILPFGQDDSALRCALTAASAAPDGRRPCADPAGRSPSPCSSTDCGRCRGARKPRAGPGTTSAPPPAAPRR